MVYETIDALPQDLKNKLPAGALETFLAACNQAAAKGKQQEEAHKIGWEAVQRDYEQGTDGKWRYHTALPYEAPEGRPPVL